jgi:uncharacterized protein DUF3604
MNNKASLKLLLLFSVLFLPSAWAADPIGEPGRNSDDKNPLKNVYFGEQHLHTSSSPDAFAVGVRGSWDDAYRYAKGEEIKLSTNEDHKEKNALRLCCDY